MTYEAPLLIEEFAEAMEAVLYEPKNVLKGDKWKEMGLFELFEKLDEEKLEFDKAVTAEDKAREVLDIANVYAMLWKRLKAYGSKQVGCQYGSLSH